MNSFLLLGIFTSVPILVKFDQEMQPLESAHCAQTIYRYTDTNRFYDLSHAMCYRYRQI